MAIGIVVKLLKKAGKSVTNARKFKIKAGSLEKLKKLKNGMKSKVKFSKKLHKRKLTLAEKIKYRRPSKFRKGVRDKVWNTARKSDGKVRDPLTKKAMKKSDPWDMGHKPGHEFRKHQMSAAERDITRKQFLDEYNNPKHYRPELPSSNRCHLGEDPSDLYFGP